MTSLPPSVLRARLLLRSLEALPGAEARVCGRIVTMPRRRVSPVLRWAVAMVGIGFAGSTAYALGYVPVQRLFAPYATSPSIESRPSKKPRAPNTMPKAATVASAAVDAPLSETAPGATDVGLAPLPAVAARPSAVAVDPTHLPAAALYGPKQSAAPSGSTMEAAAAVVALGSLPPESELSIQVSEYRAALERLPDDAAATLRQLEAHRRAWPKSSIRHEVDLRIIMTLLAVGRASDARREAQQFLASYPTSPQRPAVRRIAEAGAQDEPNDN